MAKKGLAKFKKNPSGLGSFVPSELKSGILKFVGPAAGGYVATRVVNRVARALATKKSPRFGKHAGPLASLVSLCAIYFVSKKYGKLKNYSEAIVAGSIIAVVQSLVQAYVPGLLWLFDMSPQPLPAPAPKPQLEGDDEYDEYDESDEGVSDEVQAPVAGLEAGMEEGIEDEVAGPLGEGMFN